MENVEVEMEAKAVEVSAPQQLQEVEDMSVLPQWAQKKINELNDAHSRDKETLSGALSQQKKIRRGLETSLKLTQLAVEHRLSSDQLEYLSVMAKDNFNGVKKVDDWDSEKLGSLIEKSKRAFSSMNITSVPNAENFVEETTPQVSTVEQFAKLNFEEKAEMYGKSPLRYSELMAELHSPKNLNLLK